MSDAAKSPAPTAPAAAEAAHQSTMRVPRMFVSFLAGRRAAGPAVVGSREHALALAGLHDTHVAHGLPVPCGEALDRDLVAVLQRVGAPALPEELDGRTALAAPVGDLVAVLHEIGRA